MSPTIQGKDLYDRPWSPEGIPAGEIHLADFCKPSGEVVTNLTLTEMYWLDMDPTIGNLALLGGMAEAPHPLPARIWRDGETVVTNVGMVVYLMITNRNEGASPASWSPYALRGLDPGSSTKDFVPGDVRLNSWKSETFKVTGRLLNGLTSNQTTANMMPLRWFVFTPDSFDDGKAAIEILDPHSKQSVGYYTGWGEWWEEEIAAGKERLSPLVYSWLLDRRLQPISIEVLQKDSTYEK